MTASSTCNAFTRDRLFERKVIFFADSDLPHLDNLCRLRFDRRIERYCCTSPNRDLLIVPATTAQKPIASQRRGIELERLSVWRFGILWPFDILSMSRVSLTVRDSHPRSCASYPISTRTHQLPARTRDISRVGVFCIRSVSSSPSSRPVGLPVGLLVVRDDDASESRSRHQRVIGMMKG